MEKNCCESYRCIEITKLCIKRKDLNTAWKFAVEANKLYPSSESKREFKINIIKFS